jgi:hypothetical protein
MLLVIMLLCVPHLYRTCTAPVPPASPSSRCPPCRWTYALGIGAIFPCLLDICVSGCLHAARDMHALQLHFCKSPTPTQICVITVGRTNVYLSAIGVDATGATWLHTLSGRLAVFWGLVHGTFCTFPVWGAQVRRPLSGMWVGMGWLGTCSPPMTVWPSVWPAWSAPLHRLPLPSPAPRVHGCKHPFPCSHPFSHPSILSIPFLHSHPGHRAGLRWMSS